MGTLRNCYPSAIISTSVRDFPAQLEPNRVVYQIQIQKLTPYIMIEAKMLQGCRRNQQLMRFQDQRKSKPILLQGKVTKTRNTKDWLEYSKIFYTDVITGF